VDVEELVRIRDAMAARGPDGEGLWHSADGRIGLAHRRLAIIDIGPSGAQPMEHGNGAFRITFNGEIYNYQILRQELVQRGHVFRSASDTEVLLHLYQDHGPAMLERLRGMFTLAIWDEARQGMFLARDPFGIKPLYYADDGATIRVASQVKALLAGQAIDTRPEPAGHVGFFLWGHVPDPLTLYRGVRALPAGSWTWIDKDGARTPREYFSLREVLREAEDGAAAAAAAGPRNGLREALLDTVAHHLVADVPVGVFLSSGLDSTTLTALAAETHGAGLKTFTLGFEEYRGTRDDEVPLAEQVAASYGTARQTRWVRRDDFRRDREALLAAMDQPTTDGVNVYFVSKEAREAGLKVALTGTGGDEVFGGYSTFRELPGVARALGPLRHLPAVGRGFRWVAAPLLKHVTSPKYAGLLEYGSRISDAYLLRRGLYMPWELPDVLDADMARAGWQALAPRLSLRESVAGLASDFLQVSALELTWYMRDRLLRDADWAGMAHSLEIRPPLVDIDFFKRVAPLIASAARPSKQDMARTPARPLPEAVLNRPKSGFLVPVREWLGDDSAGVPVARGLRGWAHQVYETFTG